METKVCKVCGVELPISEFKKTPMKPNGVDTCNKCCARKSAEARLARRIEKSAGGVKVSLRDSRQGNFSRSLEQEATEVN